MPTRVGGPIPTASRKGRDNQKYSSSGERLVAGCIPVRFNGPEEDPAAAEVLQVSSRGGKGWVFPKGGWEKDESAETAALRETVEEAGVRGVLEGPMLGQFEFYKHSNCLPGSRCVAHMFVLRVEEELQVWPEQEVRQRQWFKIDAAAEHCRYGWMREALLSWVRRRGWHLLLQELEAGQQMKKSNSDVSRSSTLSDTPSV